MAEPIVIYYNILLRLYSMQVRMRQDYQDKTIRRLLRNIKEHIRYFFKNDDLKQCGLNKDELVFEKLKSANLVIFGGSRLPYSEKGTFFKDKL